MNQKQNTFQAYKIWLALALAVVAIAAIAFLGLRASAGVADEVVVLNEDNRLVAYYNASEGEPEVEKWKYLIREDDTCSGSIFRDGGRDQGNTVLYHRQSDDSPIYVKYNSNVFQLDPAPFSEFIADIYIGQYICFQALLTDGSWADPAGRRIDLVETPVTGGPDPYVGEDTGWIDGEVDVDDQPPAETDRVISDPSTRTPSVEQVVWEDDDTVTTVTADFIVFGSDGITSVGYGLPDDRVEGCDGDTEYDDMSDSSLGTIVRGLTESGDTYKIVRHQWDISPERGISESTGICFLTKYETRVTKNVISLWGFPDE